MDPGQGDFGELSTDTKLDWLPAIEVRGEGVFLALNSEAVEHWEANNIAVRDRAGKIIETYTDEWVAARGDDSDPPLAISPRFLLIHTFAHALIRQLALDCGYDAAALRERIYVGGPDPDMTGLLIYTGSSDSDGTLGGLARQAEPDRIQNVVIGALEQMRWCSSDPLCLGGIVSVSETYNIAACHSCVLVPETSCEQFNRFLDRALLVGDPQEEIVGFFNDIMES